MGDLFATFPEIKIIFLAIVGMIALNWILDRIYNRYPTIQKAVMLLLVAYSVIAVVSYIVSKGTLKNMLWSFIGAQFLYFYNGYINMTPMEWTDEYDKGEIRFDSYGYPTNWTKEHKVEHHWRPAWWTKLIICVILTAISAFLLPLLQWFYLIVLGIEALIVLRH